MLLKTTIKLVFLLGILIIIPLFIFIKNSLAQQACQSSTRNEGLISGLSVAGTFGNLTAQCVLDPKAAFAVIKVPTYDYLKSVHFDQNKDSTLKLTPGCTGNMVLLNNIDFNQKPLINTTCTTTRVDDATSGRNIATGTSNKMGIIFTDGDLYIDSNLNYTGNDYGLMFIVRGDIYIAPTVTTINAMLVAEGSIYTGSQPPTLSTGFVYPTPQLIVNGSLIALNTTDPNKKIYFNRYTNNPNEPSERVNFQPKYLVKLRGFTTQAFSIQREISAAEIPAPPPAPVVIPPPAPPPTPINTNLVAYYKMNDTAGSTTILDSAGSYNGTPTNITLGQTGKIGTAAALNGTTSNINVTSASGLNFDNSTFTVSMWVKRNTTGTLSPASVQGLVGKKGSSGGGWGIYLYNSGQIWIQFTDGGSPPSSTPVDSGLITTTSINDTLWHHLVVVFNRGGNAVGYLDGNPLGTRSIAGVPGSVTNSTNLTMGIFGGNSGYYLNGSLDDVAIWNRALTATDVQNLYQGTSPQPAPPPPPPPPPSSTLNSGLVSYWKMDQSSWNGTAGEVTDSSGNNRHGRSINGTNTSATAKIGRAANFDGSNDYIDATDINELDNAQRFSISAWVKRNANGSYVLLQKRTDFLNRLSLEFWDDGKFYINLNKGSESYGTFDTGDTLWHHIVVTYDGTQPDNANKLKAYFDGAAKTLTFQGSSIPSSTANHSENFKIGNTQGGSTTYYTAGQIDEVGIWNKTLTPVEVQELYANGGGLTYPFPSPNATPTGTGYLAEFWNTADLGQAVTYPPTVPALSKADTTINYDWGTGSPGAEINPDNFIARWTKNDTFTAGYYMFTAESDDGVRLYIDGNLVLSNWQDQGPTVKTIIRNMTAGTHNIRWEYYEHSGGAVAKFSYATTSISNGTYLGEYWNTSDLGPASLIPTTGPNLVKVEPTINYDWGNTGSPDSSINTDNFVARWTTNDVFSASSYTFRAETDDGVRLYIDGTLVLDRWVDQGPTVNVLNRLMTAGTHNIRWEYYEHTQGAVAKLSYGLTPTLTVSASSASIGTSVNVTWTNIQNPTSRDWIGLYAVGQPNTNPAAWIYVSCTRFPVSARASGSCSFPIPRHLSSGTYIFKLLSNDGYSDIVTSSQLSISGTGGQRRSFVTSTTYTGNLFQAATDLGLNPVNGLDAGNKLCQARATAAGLTGFWQAWLGDSTGSPATTFMNRSSLKVTRVNIADVVADGGWSDLTDGSLDRDMNRNEYQNDPGGESAVWTAVNTDMSVSTDNCNNWTSSSSSKWGQVGARNSTSGNWTDTNYPDCSQTKRLYCFEQ